ncbi:MAG: hypothetical protein EXS32_06515 [Opitutus sp.]|nr:hypothetical protein [Opitutus sp.]
MTLNRILSTVLVGAMLFGAGCKPKAKVITSLQRKEAATLVSEAEFAVSLRDFARAEGLLAKAVGLCPDAPEYWLSLGTTRMKLHQRDGAKAAYLRGLAAYADAEGRDPKEAEPRLQQVYVLALLGRGDDARALLAKLAAKFPDNRNIRLFLEDKRLDRMLADPKFREIAL